MIEKLFRAIDSKDSRAFGEFLSQDCLFRFGNQESIHGKEQVIQFVSGFFDSVKTLSHNIVDTWNVEGAVICQGYVTYTRHNGSQLTAPFANVLKLAGAKIREYLVFADTSALYSR